MTPIEIVAVVFAVMGLIAAVKLWDVSARLKYQCELNERLLKENRELHQLAMKAVSAALLGEREEFEKMDAEARDFIEGRRAAPERSLTQ